ncbi:MAG: MaoC family dehydratase [bacterium]
MSLEAAITELETEVGTETYVGQWFTIDQDRVDRFADVTCDRQWIHTEPERAASQSPFGTTVAHGYLTLSLIPHLTESVNPDKPQFEGVKLAVNYGLNKVRFPNAVKVGARIRARKALVLFEEVKGGVQMINKITIEIEGQEKPACVAETISRVYFS